MEETIRRILALPAVLIWIILLLSAGLEYVFPPYPGDVIVLAGGVLAGLGKLSFTLVFIALILGSVGGAAIDFEIGVWLRRPKQSWLHRWSKKPRVARGIDTICEPFAKRGDLYLLVNRFVPGLRAFFFIAAGYSGLGRTRTLILATIAAALWNVVILICGLLIGANLEKLIGFSQVYWRYSWIILLLVISGWVALHLIRRRTGRGSRGE